MSPLREALMRLASDGLVILEDHKGFRVAPVSREELVDIASTRCEIEGRAFEMSIEKGDDHWEANILARFHELSKRPTYVGSGALDYEWERRHDAFHQSLYARRRGLTWMTSFCQVLAERAFRYRHLLLEVVDRTRDHRSEHEAIQQAALGARRRHGGPAAQGSLHADRADADRQLDRIALSAVPLAQREMIAHNPR